LSTDRSPPLKQPPVKQPNVTGSLAARLWQYQSERFPLANHGVLTLVFAVSACAFAAGFTNAWPSSTAILLAALAGLGQFALLRVADEHKDFATDSAHRPYRAVPRGLVTLGELRAVGIVAAALMLAAVALAQSLPLTILTLAIWIYFALMTAEFFAADWLKARPIVYLFSHMIITPLLAWLMAGFQLAHDGVALTEIPANTGGYLLSILFLGVVLELGRKIRATQDEESGVETYSALWGASVARNAWLVAGAASGVTLLIAIGQIQGSVTVALLGAAAGLAIMGLSARAFTPSQPGSGKRIEQASGAFALAVLVALAVAPHVKALP
jgi:4-hydroxybenzoate polyprenyltransferase